MRMPTGRFEPRIAKTKAVELSCLAESPIAKVEAVTENVSPRGARVITHFSLCSRGASASGCTGGAQVVYCQPLGERKICYWAPTWPAR